MQNLPFAGEKCPDDGPQPLGPIQPKPSSTHEDLEDRVQSWHRDPLARNPELRRWDERCTIANGLTDNITLKWPRKRRRMRRPTPSRQRLQLYPLRHQRSRGHPRLAIHPRIPNHSQATPTFGGSAGDSAPAGTYIKRQKIDVLEIEYDQFNSNQYNDDCNDCTLPVPSSKNSPGSLTYSAAGSAPTQPAATASSVSSATDV